LKFKLRSPSPARYARDLSPPGRGENKFSCSQRLTSSPPPGGGRPAFARSASYGGFESAEACEREGGSEREGVTTNSPLALRFSIASPHPAHLAVRDPPPPGGVSTIVLATPRHCFEPSPPDLIRCSMPSGCRQMPVEAFASAASARMTERTKARKCRKRNADKRKALLPWRRPRPRLPTGRRTSIGVPPRFSSQGVFHRKGLSLRPSFLGRGLSVERVLPAPACP
jgi:hypothetical protein